MGQAEQRGAAVSQSEVRWFVGAGRRASVVSAAMLFCLANVPSLAETSYVPGRIIVKYKDDISNGASEGRQGGRGSLDDLHRQYGVRSVRQVFPDFNERVRRLRTLAARSDVRLNAQERRLKRRLQRTPRELASPALERVYVLQIDPAHGDSLEEVAQAYARHPGIEYAEPDYYVKFCAVPNDPLYSQQWALSRMSAPAAWDIHTGSADVVVAVIDTGVTYDHPDIVDNMWVNEAERDGIEGFDDDGNGYVDDVHGYDFANEHGQPLDDFGHGTHIAGIIAAAGNNSTDVAGICWDCRIMAVKMIDPDTLGPLSRAAVAIEYAVNNGADIISSSWGMNPPSAFLEDAFEYAYSMGVICVAAAGNEASNQVFYPAGYLHVIGVAATSEGDARASFSNYGNWVDIAAPGVSILSLYFSTTRVWQGTSMACPHVSGACALLLSANPYLTPADARDVIMQNADAITPGTCRSNGRVNLFKALQGAIPVKGYVRLDAETYSGHDSIGISVADSDLAGQGSLGVTIMTSQGDRETVVLSETSVAGVYAGTIATGLGAVAQDDGMVQLSDRDSIEATYFDEHTISRAGKATVTDVAKADCRAAALVSLQVLDTGPEPVITFTADEPVTATVRYSSSVEMADPVRVFASGWSNAHSVTLRGVQSHTDYYVSVELTDLVGNTTTDSNDGQGPAFTTDTDPGDLHVPQDYPTIQAALDRCWSGRTVWVADGTYTGPGNRDIVFPARTITLRSVNGPERCIIDCQGTAGDMHRGFYFRDRQGRAAVIDGFTITGGYQHEEFSNGVLCKGAGVLLNSASPTIRNCIFTDNSAKYAGAGLCCYNRSRPLIEHCAFLDNDCAYQGGAIAALEGSEPNIAHCQFTRNSANFGAISLQGGSAVIRNCVFTENHGNVMGGAVMGGDRVQVRDCSFIGNRADFGGGAIAQGTELRVTNCLFASNTAEDYGGAIYEQVGAVSLTMVHCTLTGNDAATGKGVALQHYDGDPVVFRATNCIFADGALGLWCDDPIDPIIAYCVVQGGWPGAGNIDRDPLFADSQAGDFHLAAGSPCIDTGTLELDDLPQHDLDGLPRPIDGDGDGSALPDMGANEYRR
ncbi:MAG: S8 family serine peptidase [Sedimentisphaerales bacterium]|nr:S8 family serine peptidase [Sedimentisphaerales bacterium]